MGTCRFLLTLGRMWLMKTINKNRILFEDEHLLAVNKLSRELVVRGKGALGKLPLLDFLRQSYELSLKPIHRLDFETSGVVLFAKTNECFEEAVTKRKFAEDSTMKKIYHTLVLGHLMPKDGEIDRDLPARSSDVYIPAKTLYRTIAQYPGVTFLEAEITAGKHHQIRRHLQMIGHPLLLDEVYGNKKMNKKFSKTFGYSYFFLHAASIECRHFVTGEPLNIIAPLPTIFEEVLKKLKMRK